MKRKFEICSRVLEDNIKLFSKEICCGEVNQFHIVQGRVQWCTVVNITIYFPVLQNAGLFLTSISRRNGLHRAESNFYCFHRYR